MARWFLQMYVVLPLDIFGIGDLFLIGACPVLSEHVFCADQNSPTVCHFVNNTLYCHKTDNGILSLYDE